MNIFANRQRGGGPCSPTHACSCSKTDRILPAGDPAEGTGPGPDAGQDEDGGRTARRLPEAHSGVKRVTHSQRGTLQHASN